MFIKLRAEKDAYQMNFTDRLDTTEAIVTASVVVDRAVLSVWTQQTGFLSTNATILESGKTVQFTLDAATTGNQLVGLHRIRCVIQTSAGRILQSNEDLRIFE